MTQPVLTINGTRTKIEAKHAKLVEKIEATTKKIELKTERYRPAGDDAELLSEIYQATKALLSAEYKVETAQGALISSQKALGLLLLEGKKRHPTVEDFRAFLKKTELSLSRAYELVALAEGRVTEQGLRKATRDRVKKHRAAKKLSEPALAPESEPISVTSPDVTESARANKSEKQKAESKAAISAKALAEFTFAAQTWLPRITVRADRHQARMVFMKTMNATDDALRAKANGAAKHSPSAGGES
jgi:hypothetical protein